VKILRGAGRSRSRDRSRADSAAAADSTQPARSHLSSGAHQSGRGYIANNQIASVACGACVVLPPGGVINPHVNDTTLVKPRVVTAVLAAFAPIVRVVFCHPPYYPYLFAPGWGFSPKPRVDTPEGGLPALCGYRASGSSERYVRGAAPK